MKKAANILISLFFVLILGSVALWGGKAHAFAIPDLGEYDSTLDRNRFQTAILKFDYTQFGNMAYMTYQGAPSVLLADGSSQSLGSLYKPKNRDIEALFITKLAQGEWKENHLYQVNLLWGGSTGQESEKLYVQPSAKLGFLTRVQTGQSSILTFSAQTTIGGNLKERPCTADYGVAGTHQVKCSMASSAMAPQDTLQYLTNRSPYDATLVKVSMQWFFD